MPFLPQHPFIWAFSDLAIRDSAFTEHFVTRLEKPTERCTYTALGSCDKWLLENSIYKPTCVSESELRVVGAFCRVGRFKFGGKKIGGELSEIARRKGRM